MLFQRKIFSKLLAEKDKPQATILIGPRQVGKTTLLNQLIEVIGKDASFLKIDMDLFTNMEALASTEAFINYLKINGYKPGNKFYVFFDEVQRLKNVSLLFKNLYDHFPDIKAYATGSSALDIRYKLQDSLAGRKFIHYIYPLTWTEFLEFKGRSDLIEKTKVIAEMKGDNLDYALEDHAVLLKEFLVWGGYPAVVLNNDREGKIQLLDSIFDQYFKKDIVDFLHFEVEDVLNLKKMVQILAASQSQLLHFAHLGRELGCSLYKVKEYFNILQETFLLAALPSYFTNKHKEIIKSPKVHFIDNGVRNYFLQTFQPVENRQDRGELLESFVFQELYKQKTPLQNLYFWRDKQAKDKEVDIIKETEGRLTPIEVKFSVHQQRRDYQNLLLFADAYGLKKGIVVNMTCQKDIMAKDIAISYITPYILEVSAHWQ